MMRFLVYTFLLFFISFAGYAQVKKTRAIVANVNNLVTDTTKVLERGGYTPPPQVMAGVNDQCAGAVALNNVAPTSTVMTGGPPGNGFSTQTLTNDPYQINVGTWFYGNTSSTAWFSYTPNTAGSLSVTLTGVATMKGAEVAIFSGGCPNFTGTNSVTATANQSVIGVGTAATATTVNSPATASATCLLPNVTYYIMVGQCGSGTNYTVSTSFVGTTTGPTNNCCTNAIDISGSLNGSSVIAGTTAGASSDAPFVGGCNSSHNNVWYSFVAQGPNVEVTVAGGATLGPEFQLLSASSGTATDVCTGTSVTSVTCNTSTTGTVTATNVASTALVIGETYYISVTSTLTAGGTFSLTVNNPPPNPAGTNCATAALLCTTTPNVYAGGNTNLWGTEELNATTAGCNVSNGELHSAWYVINVITGGALTFTISPAVPTDNYDFSLFNNNPATCSLTAPVSCNSSTLTIGSGQTGISPAGNGSTFNSQLTVNAGDVFLLMVNSPKTAGTYSVTLGTDGTPTAATYTNCNNFPIILPIELAGFTAAQNDKEVDLKWSTTSEINNNYFTIERSPNGKDFEELTKVRSLSGNGNSKSTLYYSATDYVPLAGVSYYRLSQTDFNGKTTRFNIVSVLNKEDDGSFVIAPNPSDGTFYITYNCQAATTGSFKLYDNNGSLITEQSVVCETGDNKSQVDLTDRPTGIYFATFTTNSSFYRVKLLKK